MATLEPLFPLSLFGRIFSSAAVYQDSLLFFSLGLISFSIGWLTGWSVSALPGDIVSLSLFYFILPKLDSPNLGWEEKIGNLTCLLEFPFLPIAAAHH